MAERFAVFNLQGVNSKVSHLLRPDGELKAAQNIDLSVIGAVKKAAGYTKVGDTLQANKTILGLFDYERVGASSIPLAVVNNSGDTYSVLKYLNGSTWTDITGADELLASAGMEFAYHAGLDYVLMCNGDNMYSLQGTTFSDSTNVTNAPNGKDLTIFKERVYVIGDSSYKGKVLYSDLPTTTIVWDNDNNQFLIPYSEDLVAIVTFGDQLLTFTDNSLWRCSVGGAGLERVHGAPGTHSPKSVFVHGRFVFYYYRDGFYVYDGVSSRRISNKIEDYITDIDQTKLDEVCGGAVGTHAHFFVGDLSTKSLTNVGFDYDLIGNTFAPLAYGFEPKVVAPFIVSGQLVLYAGGNDGIVYKINSGTDAGGSAINSWFRMNDLHFNFPEYRKTIRAFYLIAKKETGTTVTVKVSKDFGSYAAFGSGSIDLGAS